jgi:protein dithiol oxidoreductase (disulfide-forming)
MISRRASFATTAAFAALAFAGVAAAADPLAPWRVGVNYRLVENPQPPTVASGKVEVTEVFWYGCGHCFALDPVLEGWIPTKPDFIEFVRVPVIWQQVHRQHAKLYYTLQALHRLDLHPKVFDAIHTEGLLLTDRDESKARALQFAFLNRHGITQQQFDAVYDSMSVAMNIQRAENYTRSLGIDNVPSLFVNGKYATSVGEAGGDALLLTLLTNLAESEKH